MKRDRRKGVSADFVRLPPEVLSGLLDNRYEGVTIVDREGIIIYMSRSTERYFDLAPGAGIGRHVTEVFPGSRLHMVARTGKAEIGAIVEARGQRKIVSRIPIFKDGEIVGAVSKIMFRDIQTLMQVSVQIQLVDKPPFNDPQRMRQVEGVRFTIDDVLGASPQAVALRDFIRMASKTSSNVLIVGETGSGKEVTAQAIHHLSTRGSGPFVSVNCSSIPQNLFESELFGYAPGAFTGAARKGKIGIIPLAHRGTLFLDEVSELPLEMQPKLLRVLEEKALYPLGDTRKVSVDFRLIAASNKDIESLVRQGCFREDLFYRLNVLTVRIPPLRERAEDIPCLAQHILERLRKRMETEVRSISADAMGVLLRYRWGGNVRELENVLERAINVAAGDTIGVDELPRSVVAAATGLKLAGDAKTMLRTELDRAEMECIRVALERARGNKVVAAKILGIHRTNLYQKMRKHHLT